VNRENIKKGMQVQTSNGTKFDGILGMMQTNVRIRNHFIIFCFIQLSFLKLFYNKSGNRLQSRTLHSQFRKS
jgi:hypothetical protein